MEKRDNIDTSSLLALVEARPVLWDKWHQDYKDRPMTKSAWEHICKKLNPQYEELDKTDQTKFCRNLVRKWANIRARFSRARKSNKKYVFSNQLQFLVDVLDIHTDEDDSHSNKSEEVTKGSSFLEKVKTETTIIKTEPSIENMDDEETTDNTMSNNDDSSAEDCANATSSNPPEKFFPNIKVKIEPEDTDEDTDTDADADTDSGSASYDDMDIDQDDEVSLDCAGKCKQRWESLRSQFRKHVRNQRTKTGDPGGSSVIWRYGENLQFLLPYMKEKIRISSLDGSEVKEEEGEVSQESNEPVAQVTVALQKRTGELPNQDHVALKTPHCQVGKRKFPPETTSTTPMKHVFSKHKKEEEIDDYDLFFDAMKKTIKRFSPVDKLLVKRRLFSIVAEIEDKYVAEQHQQMYMANVQYGHHSFTPYSRISRLQSSPPCYEETTNQSATTLSSESRPSSAGVKTEVKEEEDLIIEDDEHGCHMWLKEAASDPDLLYPNVTLEENPSRPAKRPRSDSYPNAESFLKNKENTLKNKENTLKNKENTLKKPLLKDVPPDPVVMEALGIVWASKLRSLEETQKVLAEDIVNQILKKGFFKELTRKSEVRKVS